MLTTSRPASALRVRDEISLPPPGAPIVARAKRADEYVVHVTRTLGDALDRLAEALDGAAVAIVTDDVVEALYGADVIRGLRERGVEPLVAVIPAGEGSKSVDEAVRLWHWLAESPLARRDVIVTLGGGVLADLGGWVASAYMRGLPYVNLPTTLLGQVDGALGGKVAANHPAAKNLIGAFHQPRAVISNVGFLSTLEDRHLSAGVAEAIKKAVIASPEYFEFITVHAEALRRRDGAALERLVHCASAIKTALIARDPYEDDLRRPLNFGHTIGHPVETVSGYGPLLHGEAVAFGMVAESRIAVARGLMPEELLGRLVALLRTFRLPTHARELPIAIEGDAVVAAMEKVRLIRAGSLRWVLPVHLGETLIVDDVSTDEVAAALDGCGLSLSAPARRPVAGNAIK
jgi:3-dehydroquinate synthase